MTATPIEELAIHTIRTLAMDAVQAANSGHPGSPLPEATLHAFADHGELGAVMSADGVSGEKVIGEFSAAGILVEGLAAQLQAEGAGSFVKSWEHLLTVIDSKSRALDPAAHTARSAS